MGRVIYTWLRTNHFWVEEPASPFASADFSATSANVMKYAYRDTASSRTLRRFFQKMIIVLILVIVGAIVPDIRMELTTVSENKDCLLPFVENCEASQLI
jgi:hypothetical protein